METVLRSNGQIVWGAVGFRDRANDSPDDKRWARDKFKSDVRDARDANPTLHGLVFFTNVDFTPGEITELEGISREAGLAFVDIFYRERMRVLLDEPRGFALRYQYLQIEMSNAEQAAFFGRWGDAVHQLLSTRFDAVEDALREIKFHQATLRPIRDVRLILELDRTYRLEELGAFGISGHLHNHNESLGNSPHGLWFAFRDAVSLPQPAASDVACDGVLGLIHSPLGFGIVESHQCKGPTAALEIWTSQFNQRRPGSFDALHDLDGGLLRVFVTRSLHSKIRRVCLEVNGYVLLDMASSGATWVKAQAACMSWQGAQQLTEALPGEHAPVSEWLDLRRQEYEGILRIDFDAGVRKVCREVGTPAVPPSLTEQ